MASSAAFFTGIPLSFMKKVIIVEVKILVFTLIETSVDTKYYDSVMTQWHTRSVSYTQLCLMPLCLCSLKALTALWIPNDTRNSELLHLFHLFLYKVTLKILSQSFWLYLKHLRFFWMHYMFQFLSFSAYFCHMGFVCVCGIDFRSTFHWTRNSSSLSSFYPPLLNIIHMQKSTCSLHLQSAVSITPDNGGDFRRLLLQSGW